MNRGLLLPLLALVTLPCCKKPPPSAGATADASLVVDDGGATSTSNEPEGANLLQLVPSKVAVSSTVDNPRDFPEHVMDGKLETAWNGRTGDLNASIFFRVPKDAWVDRLELTVGFDTKNAKHDLFTANHRIKKVTVFHDGTKLRDVDLEPTKRGWQAIPIAAGGGDFRIQVLETLPGTQKSWKEIVISEMRVIGKPGKERRKPGETVRIAVGTLDSAIDKTLPPDLKRATLAAQAEMAAVCEQWKKSVAEHWKSVLEDPNPMYPEDKTKPPHCKEVPFKGAFAGDAKWKSVKALRVGYSNWESTRLVAEVARGWVMTPIAWALTGSNPLGCPATFIELDVPDVRVVHGYLVAVVDGERRLMAPDFNPDKTPNDGGWRTYLHRGLSWCKDTGTEVTCEEHNPSYRYPLAWKVQPTEKGGVPWAKLPWKDVLKYELKPDGTLVTDEPT